VGGRSPKGLPSFSTRYRTSPRLATTSGSLSETNSTSSAVAAKQLAAPALLVTFIAGLLKRTKPHNDWRLQRATGRSTELVNGSDHSG